MTLIDTQKDNKYINQIYSIEETKENTLSWILSLKQMPSYELTYISYGEDNFLANTVEIKQLTDALKDKDEVIVFGKYHGFFISTKINFVEGLLTNSTYRKWGRGASLVEFEKSLPPLL